MWQSQAHITNASLPQQAAQRTGDPSTSAPSEEEVAARQQRAAARQRVLATRTKRAAQLVEQLARCRRTPQIRLMKVLDKGSSRYDLDVLLPLCVLMRSDTARFGDSDTQLMDATCDGIATMSAPRYTWDVDEGDGEAAKDAEQQQQGAKLRFVLPWLVTTNKKLGMHGHRMLLDTHAAFAVPCASHVRIAGLREIEYLGSQLRLCGLLQLDLARVRRRRVGMWCAQYKVRRAEGTERAHGALYHYMCHTHMACLSSHHHQPTEW